MIARNAMASTAVCFALLLSGAVGLGNEVAIPKASPGRSESKPTNTNTRKETPPTKGAGSSPPTSPAGTSSTPNPESSNSAKRDLRVNVDSALAEAKDAGSAARTTDFKQLASLEDQVDHFKKKLDSPEGDLVELQGEANEIVRVANHLRDEETPGVFATLFGLRLIDYLNRIVIVTGLLLAMGIIILLVRLSGRVTKLGKSLESRLNENLASLQTIQSSAKSCLKLCEERQVIRGEALESFLKDLQATTGLVIASLDNLAERIPKEEKSSFGGGTIPEEGSIEAELLAEQIYVGEFLQRVAADRQTAVAYEIANSIFVADPLGKLVVVTNNHNSDFAVVLPRASRLNSPEQFYTYFKEAYRCEHVSVGPMFILKAAIVEKLTAGWALVTPGDLEIRG